MASEKQHDALMHNISEFRSDKLKRTSTSEKIVIPTPAGMICGVGCSAFHASTDLCLAPVNETCTI